MKLRPEAVKLRKNIAAVRIVGNLGEPGADLAKGLQSLAVDNAAIL